MVTSANRTVGMKRYLGFYIGEAPAGMKTSWIMEEYRLLSSDSSSSSRRKSSKTRANPKTVSFAKFSFIKNHHHA